MKKNSKNIEMENKLEKELIALRTMVKMRLLNMEEFKKIVKDIGERYNIQPIIRNHDLTTDTTTIEFV